MLTQRRKVNKKIIFIVNTVGMTGGIRVIFEYAKRLRRDGYDIRIVHLLRLRPGQIGFFIAALKKLKWLMIGATRIAWFDLGGLPIDHLFSLKKIKADILIASAYETAKPLAEVKTPAKKIYFIQGYESWGSAEADATYRLPLKKIAISSFVADILRKKLQIKVDAIATQGIEIDDFNVEAKKFNRKKIIAMLYHTLPVKGTAIGLSAIKIIAAKHPEVSFRLFGMYRPRENLPASVRFYFDPSRPELKKIYAEADILLSPSLSEGFSLIPMEAMAASCAVISTKVGGITDHSKNGVSAIWVAPGNAEVLATAAIDLIENDAKLRRIARAGHKEIQKFSIEKSYKNFRELILKI